MLLDRLASFTPIPDQGAALVSPALNRTLLQAGRIRSEWPLSEQASF